MGRHSRKKKKVAILGAAGYAGGELLRYLLFHPRVEVKRVTSSQNDGQAVWRAHPNLRGVTDLVFQDLSPAEAADGVDLVFCALQRGAGMRAVRKLPEDVRVIDLSGDFVLKDPALYRKIFGKEHLAPDLLDDFVYGLCEFEPDAIAQARLVANPNSFAAAALLALLPLAREGMLTGPIVLNGVTGSSEFGSEARVATHHPERAEAYKAFRVTDHPQTPEIMQRLVAHGASAPEITFVPYLAPMTRGMFLTAYVRPLRPVSRDVARRVFARAYADKPFVRMVESSPDSNVVAGTNFADVTADVQGFTILVLVAIDNLIKGGAGHAVQCMNLMFGWEESDGLEWPGMMP